MDTAPAQPTGQVRFTSQPKPTPNSFQRFAQICWWLPICAGLLCEAAQYAFKGQHSPTIGLVSLGLVTLTVLACCTSGVLGIIALCGIPKHGTQGILWRAGRGILLSTALLGYLGTGFIHGFQEAMKDHLAQLSLRHATQEVRAKSRPDAPDATPANKAPVDNSPAGRATAAFHDEMQKLSTEYSAAAEPIHNPSVLDMSGVDKREQLQPRKELVKSFLASNEKLITFINSGETKYREILTKFNVPAPTADSTIKNYRHNDEERDFLLVRIRQGDQQIGDDLLGMLDVLDARWGNWKYNPARKNVAFTDDASLAKFNAYFKDMAEAAAAQKQLQMQFVNMPVAPTQ
jgi:hypothetical protein